ncbi:(2Fe-2S)-binding protein [Nguyenibacter vanlangensis]|uniref:(2Fe-2S)-binding protein n=1 Tax=Nguyenibacter vanlangensis TaxID=1216886 RepID=A0A7Y7IZA9_9PROT|nr:(2Fe-2S)-binding protein [Nguyenibacter vanlangensis]NVN12555.1 (2Fe-2S)-binding protein [Nguyenibacter vanlangensis]
MQVQFRRVAETGRRTIALVIDGRAVEACEGDTLLVAMMTNTTRLRQNEFDHRPRAGFCLMGACQDCWVWTEDGEQLRACSTTAQDGMRIRTQEAAWTTGQ